jgi:hypothetical protein
MFTIQRISVRRLPEAPFSSKILIIDDVRIQLALSKISTLPSSTSGVAPQLASLCAQPGTRHLACGSPPNSPVHRTMLVPPTPTVAASASQNALHSNKQYARIDRKYPASEAARNSKGSEAWPEWNGWGLKVSQERQAAGCFTFSVLAPFPLDRAGLGHSEEMCKARMARQCVYREGPVPASSANGNWSRDSVSDSLFSRRGFSR